MSIKTQKLIVIALSVILVIFTISAIVYSANNPDKTASVSNSNNLAEVDDEDGEVQENPEFIKPITKFFPSGGAGTACTESVGVVVKQGYGAILTINNQKLTDSQLNVNLNDDGTVSNKITATRSSGEYSYKPSEECPKSGLIRPQKNILNVCVYSKSDITKACVYKDSFEFDAI